MKDQGILLCAKYATSPNLLGYCGPDDFQNIIDHLRENVANRELELLLCQFETLFPYLNLIAKTNKTDDPFDERVVEAYWIGNPLLEKVKEADLIFHLRENLLLERKLAKVDFKKLIKKSFLLPFLPHHAFHVVNIFKMARLDLDSYKIEAIDNCRIGWGEIDKILNIKNKKYRQKIKKMFVKTKPLSKKNGALILDRPVLREIKVDYKGKEFIKNLKVGDWVSFHWGYLCDVLNHGQVENLKFYSQKAIDFYNADNLAIAI